MKFFVVGSIFLVAVGVLIGVSVSAGSIPVVTLAELQGPTAEFQGRRVQLNGKVAAIDRERLYPLRFAVSQKGHAGEPLKVVSKLSPPENFKIDTNVMLQGTYDRGTQTFEATTIMTKCPSRYEATEEAKKADEQRASGELLDIR